MKVLTRFKKKEMEGFKEYVMNFETSPRSKRVDKFFLGALEDPVFMNWVLKNVLAVEEILHFNADDFGTICERLKQSPQTFALAFYNHPQMGELEALLKGNFKTQILEETGMIKEKGFSPAKQESAQYVLIQNVRKLQKENAILGWPWRLPDLSVVKVNKNIRPTSFFELFYENGNYALKGQLKNSMRTGEWCHYYSNTKMMALGSYELDEKVGKWIIYFSDGKVKAEGEFKEGQKIGQWKEFNKTGQFKLVDYPLIKN